MLADPLQQLQRHCCDLIQAASVPETRLGHNDAPRCYLLPPLSPVSQTHVSDQIIHMNDPQLLQA